MFPKMFYYLFLVFLVNSVSGNMKKDPIREASKKHPYLPLICGTAFFGACLIICPCCCARKGPNKGIVQVSMVLAIFGMWIFWATVFIAQMHPLIGPRHKNSTLIWYKQAEYDDPLTTTTTTTVAPAVAPDAAPAVAPDAEPAGEPAAEPEAPPGGDQTLLRSRPSHCRNQPNNLFECCNIPWLPKRAIDKCIDISVDILTLTCSQARCAFQAARWASQPGVVNMSAMTDFYDGLERNDADWSTAVRLIKDECLLAYLKFQGIYTNCPEYDIIFCAVGKMLQHAPLPNWSTAGPCQSAQEYVGRCPICPLDCIKYIKDKPFSKKCQACVPY